MLDFRIWLFVALTSLSAPLAFGQDYGMDMAKLTPRKLRKIAANASNFNDPYTAIRFYEEYMKRKPEDHSIKLDLGIEYLEVRDYFKAEETFREITEVKETKLWEAWYYLGLALKAQERYESAMDNFKEFKSRAKSKMDPAMKKRMKAEMAGCELALQLGENGQTLQVTHLDTSINKAHIEFSPVLMNDTTLLFGSLRSDSLIYYDREKDLPPVRRLYIAKRRNGFWVYDKEVEINGIPKDAHIASANLFGTNELYISVCKTTWQGDIHCDIYYSPKSGDGWGKATPIPEGVNHPAFSSTHPFVTIDDKKGEKIMYFASDRTGGKGGYDIWASLYDGRKATWKLAKNLGAKVNSFGDEITPYVDTLNNQLYYSSDGLPGMGGLDIFVSERNGNKWAESENVGVPLNTGMDELFYVPRTDLDTESGMFVSNREGAISLKNESCCDDIFEYVELKERKVEIVGNILKNTENDSLANFTDSLVIEYFSVNPMNGQSDLIERDTLHGTSHYGFSGKDNENYKVTAKSKGYYTTSISISTNGIQKDTLVKDITLNKIVINKAIKLDNVYYEFGSAELTQVARQTLDSTLVPLLKDNPTLSIEISSHTDSKGDDNFNMKLSQDRAQSTVNYLIEKGIAKEKLQAKGYGETMPVAPNTNEDGSDNPEGREKNRRTEFKVIGQDESMKIQLPELLKSKNG